VGRCDGVTALFDRSERIQGHRKEIDELRRRWEARCTHSADESDEGQAAGKKGKGNGKGKGHGENG
jgi:hypothetical protein